MVGGRWSHKRCTWDLRRQNHPNVARWRRNRCSSCNPNRPSPWRASLLACSGAIEVWFAMLVLMRWLASSLGRFPSFSSSSPFLSSSAIDPLLHLICSLLIYHFEISPYVWSAHGECIQTVSMITMFVSRVKGEAGREDGRFQTKTLVEKKEKEKRISKEGRIKVSGDPSFLQSGCGATGDWRYQLSLFSSSPLYLVLLYSSFLQPSLALVLASLLHLPGEDCSD